MKTGFMIKATKNNETLYLEDVDMINFVKDKEEAYIFDDANQALSFLDELKQTYPDDKFNIVVMFN